MLGEHNMENRYSRQSCQKSQIFAAPNTLCLKALEKAIEKLENFSGCQKSKGFLSTVENL